MIYLDNNATTRVSSEVVDSMLPYFTEQYWNPSSHYDPSTALAKELQEARKKVANAIGAAFPSEILFTSCATESNNAAIFGALRANSARKHLITSKVEHPAVLEVAKELQRSGYDISWIDVDSNGNLDIQQFVRALRPQETLLVSLMHANNETGVIFPIERLSRITKETDPNIVFHTDATQSVTKLPINLSANFRHVDLLSFSGHKIHAPKGIGVLYVRKGTPLRQFLIGGHQENGRRGGTENVPYIIGLAKALELAYQTHDEDITRMERLRDKLQQDLLAKIPFLVVNGKESPRLPNTLNVAIHAVEGEAILMAMNEQEVCISSGSACTSGSLDPSHVLVAMKVPPSALQGSVRFSLSHDSTEGEIDRVIEIFPKIINQLRTLSPFWDKQKNEPLDRP